MNKFFLSLLVLCTSIQSLACTNFIVGKDASADGSVIVTYNADSYGMYGNLYYHLGSTHQKGEMRKIYEWDTNKYLGEIPQASVTYTVMGQMNEHQVSVTETTFGGREELMDSTGIIDYGSLIYIALERSRTAREAIDIMTSLVDTYGYYSEGETFSICDKNEAWLMEMIGKGPGGHGAVWVAVRIPDDCISGHANQSRITRFLQLFPKENVMYSRDVIKIARQKGYFTGKDKDFSFRDAYAPNDFSAVRICDARVWSFFNHHVKGMEKYLDYITCKDINSEMPLYLRPDQKVSVRDVMADMRDHFEDTPFDIRYDLGAGPYNMPYRPSPLTVNVDGVEMFNERPTSTFQTGFSFIGQMRGWLPDRVGGVVWWTNDDANMAPYIPLYCGADEAPQCYKRIEGVQDDVTFSWNSAFWLQNVVADFVYPYYSMKFPDLKAERDKVEDYFFSDEYRLIETTLKSLEQERLPSQLAQVNENNAARMMSAWSRLFAYLAVKYNDMVVKKVDAKGNFLKTPYGYTQPPVRPGYSEDMWRAIKNQTGQRYVKP
ncbi:MAG: C69 family dipeptidase [Bacteroidaceae bacterium]|nr:C69 family dipeptidase [Bacteroidaceae bacterium]